MSDRHSSIAGTRMLIIGASSGIGQALALAAHSRGASVALAARRIHLLSKLAGQLHGSAHELDVSDPRAIESVVGEVVAEFGRLDAVVFTSAMVPFALIEETDVETWLHAYAVNAVGASHVVRATLPHLADNAVVVVASNHDVGGPRASRYRARTPKWSAKSFTGHPESHGSADHDQQLQRKDARMDLGFEGATAVVNGGSKGMGLAIAESLGAEGASVAIMARGRAALDVAAEQIRRAGAPEVLAIGADMADAESIAAAFASVGEAWGSLNVLVHTVGPNAGAFEDLDDDDWHAAFDLGTLSAVRSVRAALPLLRSADWARIVTLSAHSIQRQSARLVAYTASKSALSSFTKNLSKTLGAEGILVNCVCPGTIVTASFTEILRDVLAADGLDSSDPYDVMTWVETTYGHPCDVGRAGLPEEIASVTTYLASRRNGYVTGATVNVDGGSDFI